MLLWAVMAILTAAALAVLLRPLARRDEPVPQPRATYDLTLYRAQLDELARDVERGVTSAGEAASARLEIERRMLAVAASPAEAGSPVGRGARWATIFTVVAVPAVALPLYIWLGSPDLPDAPLAARGAETKLLAADGSLDLDKARISLEAKLKERPDSLEGWMLLGRTDTTMRRWPDAHAAYDKALALSGRAPDVLEADSEMLIAEAGGTVTPAAKAVLEETLQKAPESVAARYDLALAKAQAGDYAAAIAAWQALAEGAPADAPWLPQVRDIIAEAQRRQSAPPESKQPEESQPPPAGQAPPGEMAQQMMKLPPGEREAAIRSMVAALAAKLEQSPNDLAGWTRLGRSYHVLGDEAKAADAYAHAVALAPQDAGLALAHAQTLRAAGGPTLSDDTMAAYRQVTALDADQPEALYVLGLAARQHGHADEGAALWRRLLAQMPADSPDAVEIKKQLDAPLPTAPSPG